MTKGKWPNGLAEAMSRKGIGPTALARLVGTSKQNIDRWAKEERELVAEVAKKLAPHLNTTADALLLLPDVPEAMVAGAVGAGGAIINVDEDMGENRRTIPVLAGDLEGAGAVEIKGASLGPFEGWYAVMGRRATFTDQLYGRLCVVQTADDKQIFIKWVERTRRKGVKLVSGDGEIERDGVELEWAAPVIGMRPR